MITEHGYDCNDTFAACGSFESLFRSTAAQTVDANFNAGG